MVTIVTSNGNKFGVSNGGYLPDTFRGSLLFQRDMFDPLQCQLGQHKWTRGREERERGREGGREGEREREREKE